MAVAVPIAMYHRAGSTLLPCFVVSLFCYYCIACSSSVIACRSALWRFVSQTKTTNKNTGFTQGSRRTALKQGFRKDFKIPDPKEKATYNSAADAEPGALPQHKSAKHFNENNEGRICVTFEVGTCTCNFDVPDCCFR